MSEIVCGDDRFEIIEDYKKKLIEATNIETSPEEMAVIDSILFRFWQVGWLNPHKNNADRIRAMTDEELAVWLGDMLGVYPFGPNQWDSQRWLEYLKQEAVE